MSTYKPRDFVDHQGIRKSLLVYVKEDMPVLLSGEPGTGKTTLIQSVVQELWPEKPLKTVVGTSMTLRDLFCHTELKNNETSFKEAATVQCVRNGWPLYVDEVNWLSDSLLKAISPLLDNRRFLYVPQSNERIDAASGFRFIASFNPQPAALGNRLLAEFKNRFVQIRVERMPEEVEIEFLVNRYSIAESDAERLVAFSKCARDVSPRVLVSTRNVESAAKALSKGVPWRHAVEHAIVNLGADDDTSLIETILAAAEAQGLLERPSTFDIPDHDVIVTALSERDDVDDTKEEQALDEFESYVPHAMPESFDDYEEA